MQRLRVLFLPLPWPRSRRSRSPHAATTTRETTAEGTASKRQFRSGVGALVPLTGDLAEFGPPGEKAADRSSAQVSSRRRWPHRHHVHEESADAPTERPRLSRLAKQLISGGANCLAGPWASSETVPVGRSVAARDEIPLISPSSTSPEITDLPDDGFVSPHGAVRRAPGSGPRGRDRGVSGTEGRRLGRSSQRPVWRGHRHGVQRGLGGPGGSTTGDPVIYDSSSPLQLRGRRHRRQQPGPVRDHRFRGSVQQGRRRARADRRFRRREPCVTDGLAFEDGIPDSIASDDTRRSQRARARAVPRRSPRPPRRSTSSTRRSVRSPRRRGTFDAQNFDAVIALRPGGRRCGFERGPAIAEQIQAVCERPG